LTHARWFASSPVRSWCEAYGGPIRRAAANARPDDGLDERWKSAAVAGRPATMKMRQIPFCRTMAATEHHAPAGERGSRVPSLFARTASRLSLGHIQRVAPVAPATASGPVAAVYRQMVGEFGMLAPPVALHAAAPDVLAAVWLMLRETLLAGDPAHRAAKEAVAASVSLANTCPYCVEVHGAALVGVRGDGEARRIAAGRLDDVADPRLRELTRWAYGSGQWTAARRIAAPFPAAQAPLYIGVAVVFQYINRMVNVFLSDSPLDPLPRRGHAVGRAVAARVFGHFARVAQRPGLARDLLPDAALPDDVAWAAGDRHIADAMARGCAAIEAAGAQVLPAAVRDLVTARLADPDAEPPGMIITPWLAHEVAGLAPDERAAGRLALLTAWASHRVTDAAVEEYRAAGHGDADLVRLTSWASLAAARQVGRTLYRDLQTLEA
jgi:AhpD family alkylhydroperoxidase